MFQTTDLLFIYTETPLHAGAGAGLGAVDLPIQRERITGYPLVQASAIKGVLRGMAETSEGKNSAKVVTAFGPDTNSASDHAGAVSPGDARLLLFPVRSLLGIFAWTTSPDVLNRFVRDAKFAGQSVNWKALTLPKSEGNGQIALVGQNSVLKPEKENQVVLEEFSFDVQPSEVVDRVATWLANNALPAGDEYAYWREALPDRLIILPEDDFREFTRFSTEVVTRIKLKQETKTVDGSALWTEENLPTDTLLYVPVYATQPRNGKDKWPEGWVSEQDVLAFVRTLATNQNRTQLGGNETIGRGIVALRWAGSSQKEANNG